MDSRRQSRINELLRVAISEIIQRELKVSFNGMITIKSVRISPDLSVAFVDFSVLGADDNSALKYLNNAKSAITKQLAQKVRLRILPKLQFAPDEVTKRVERIEELIKQIHSNDQ
jgi:ribosome-binding factor A